MTPCQCEHEAHFDLSAADDPMVGHSCHKYMNEFPESYVVEVRTTYGTYKMCKDCAHTIPERFLIQHRWVDFIRVIPSEPKAQTDGGTQ